MPISTLATELATVYDFTVEQGTLVRLSIPVLDSSGNPFTVTGWTVDAEIKTSDRGGTLLYTWLSGAVSASGTNVILTVLPATSLAWDFLIAWYRVVVQHPTDATQRHRILQGKLLINAD